MLKLGAKGLKIQTAACICIVDLQRTTESTQGLVSGCKGARHGRKKLTALVHKASLE